MPGFKIFIFSLFIWLSIASPDKFTGLPSHSDNQTEINISSYGTGDNALLVDNHLETNRANSFLKTFKIPYFHSNDKFKQPIAKTYDSKLIYLGIGNTIPLKLTARTIIFPFHFFT